MIGAKVAEVDGADQASYDRDGGEGPWQRPEEWSQGRGRSSEGRSQEDGEDLVRGAAWQEQDWRLKSKDFPLQKTVYPQEAGERA